MANARLKVVRRASSTSSRKRKVTSAPKRNPKRTVTPRSAIQAAMALSARFHQLAPRRVKKVFIKWPRALMQIGGASQINYLSDKFDGKVREYWHRFSGPATVYTGEQAQPDGYRLLIIRGKFKITDRGIVG